MQPADTQAETPDLSPILQAGEEVLWSEPRQRRALICRRRIRKWRIDYEAPIARDLIHTHCRAAMFLHP